MLEHLFGSKTRIKLLRLFFRNAKEKYFVRELTRLLDVQINAIRRELELLLKAGLIQEVAESEDGKSKKTLRKYYSLDTSSILYPEMQALLVKAQVLGERKFSDELVEKGGKIKLLILSGQFTGTDKAPSDILLVGDIKERSLARLIKKYEKEFGFDIRYTIMSEDEFFDRRHVMDKFLFSMFEVGHMKVLDKLGV